MNKTHVSTNNYLITLNNDYLSINEITLTPINDR